MDEIDKRIIDILLVDGRASLKKISEQIHLSIPATKNRLTKLEESQYISGYTAVLNEKAFGKNIFCYCLIDLKEDKEDTFLAYVQSSDHIVECYRLAGNYQYVLKIGSESTDSLEDLLVELRAKGGIRKTITFPILSAIK